LKISDIDASKFSIKVLGKERILPVFHCRAVFFVFKRAIEVENEVDSVYFLLQKKG
jgi:hypothetical protein